MRRASPPPVPAIGIAYRSPSTSKTIVSPSGLTVTFTHVASSVSNRIVCVGPNARATSQAASVAVVVSCASRAVSGC